MPHLAIRSAVLGPPALELNATGVVPTVRGLTPSRTFTPDDEKAFRDLQKRAADTLKSVEKDIQKWVDGDAAAGKRVMDQLRKDWDTASFIVDLIGDGDGGYSALGFFALWLDDTLLALEEIGEVTAAADKNRLRDITLSNVRKFYGEAIPQEEFIQDKDTISNRRGNIIISSYSDGAIALKERLLSNGAKVRSLRNYRRETEFFDSAGKSLGTDSTDDRPVVVGSDGSILIRLAEGVADVIPTFAVGPVKLGGTIEDQTASDITLTDGKKIPKGTRAVHKFVDRGAVPEDEIADRLQIVQPTPPIVLPAPVVAPAAPAPPAVGDDEKFRRGIRERFRELFRQGMEFQKVLDTVLIEEGLEEFPGPVGTPPPEFRIINDEFERFRATFESFQKIRAQAVECLKDAAAAIERAKTMTLSQDDREAVDDLLRLLQDGVDVDLILAIDGKTVRQVVDEQIARNEAEANAGKVPEKFKRNFPSFADRAFPAFVQEIVAKKVETPTEFAAELQAAMQEILRTRFPDAGVVVFVTVDVPKTGPSAGLPRRFNVLVTHTVQFGGPTKQDVEDALDAGVLRLLDLKTVPTGMTLPLIFSKLGVSVRFDRERAGLIQSVETHARSRVEALRPTVVLGPGVTAGLRVVTPPTPVEPTEPPLVVTLIPLVPVVPPAARPTRADFAQQIESRFEGMRIIDPNLKDLTEGLAESADFDLTVTVRNGTVVRTLTLRSQRAKDLEADLRRLLVRATNEDLRAHPEKQIFETDLADVEVVRAGPPAGIRATDAERAIQARLQAFQPPGAPGR